MMAMMQAIGGVVILVLASQYLLGPLVVRTTAWHPARFNFTASAPGFEPLPETKKHAGTVRELEAMGFEFLHRSGVPGPARGLATFLRAPGDGAFVYVASLKSGTKSVEFVEFCHWYENNKLLVVNNSPEIPGIGSLPQQQMVRLPHLTDLAELYGAFRSIFLYLQSQGLRPVCLHESEILPSVDRVLNEEAEYFRALGYFYPARSDRFGLTLKGAALMTWRQCFPIKQIINHRDRRQSGELLMRAWGGAR